MRPERPAQPRPLASSAAERIGAIVEAAERAAESVIDDAEAQARRYLAQAQADADRVVAERLAALSELLDSLLARAEAIREQADGMVGSLERARAELGSDRRPEAAPRGSHLSAVATDPEPEPAQPPIDLRGRDGEGGTPAGARLLVTQMAVSGSSRGEIERTLRNGFEISDTTAILDAILGPEE
ncbi:MAG: hypothetical protein WD810_01960 [Solirubrobacterales bacterium]